MARFLLFPHRALRAEPDSLDEFVQLVMFPKGGEGSTKFLATTHTTVVNCPHLALRRKSWNENVTAAKGHILKYQEQMSAIVDADGDTTLDGTLVTAFNAILKTIKHLKSTGIQGLVNKEIEEQVVEKLTAHCVMSMAFTKSNSVPDDFCKRLQDLLAEASITFPAGTSGAKVLELQEHVSSEMRSARMQGQRTSLIGGCKAFMC